MEEVSDRIIEAFLGEVSIMKTMRTRTKVLIWVLIYLGLLLGAIVATWIFANKTDAPKMIEAILGSGLIISLIHWLTVGAENILGKKEEPPKS
jgi:hypothetical protein